MILSQMLRGFAHSVRHREELDTFQLALAMREAVSAARAALTKPVEGTIISVAGAAAEEAYRLAVREPDFYRLLGAVVRTANAALDEPPNSCLPSRKPASSTRAAPDSATSSKGHSVFCPRAPPA